MAFLYEDTKMSSRGIFITKFFKRSLNKEYQFIYQCIKTIESQYCGRKPEDNIVYTIRFIKEYNEKLFKDSRYWGRDGIMPEHVVYHDLFMLIRYICGKYSDQNFLILYLNNNPTDKKIIKRVKECLKWIEKHISIVEKETKPLGNKVIPYSARDLLVSYFNKSYNLANEKIIIKPQPTINTFVKEIVNKERVFTERSVKNIMTKYKEIF